MQVPQARFKAEIYRDSRQEFRWRVRAPNGRIAAQPWLRSGSNRVHAPRSWDASQLMFAAVVELKTRTGDEVDHRARDNDLARSGEGRDALPDVNGDAADVLAPKFYLTGMEARSHLDTEHANRFNDGLRAADGSCRAVEGCKDAISGGTYLAPGMPVELSADDRVVLVEYLSPLLVAEARCVLCRAHDVGEEHRR
jgi:hypothetical protein